MYGITVLAYWINGAAMEEDCAYTSFAKSGTVLLASMLPSWRSYIAECESDYKMLHVRKSNMNSECSLINMAYGKLL